MKKVYVLFLISMSWYVCNAQSFTVNYLKYNSTGTQNRIKPDFIDYDGDGKLDVIGGFESRIDFLHFKNEGTTFSIHSVADSVLGYPIVETIDFNNDGFMDFVAVINDNSADENIYLYLNDGNNNYNSHLMFASQGDEVEKIELADMDGDGDYDAVVDFNANINAFVYIQNDGGNTFSWNYIMFTGQPADLYGVADLDSDGLPDIVGSHLNFSTNMFDLLAIETDTVGGTNFIYHSVASYNYTRNGVLGDFVGTNATDIIVTPSSSSTNCQLLQNNGNFTFSNVAQPSIQLYGQPYLPKDYDNDGDLDFLTSGGNQGIELVKNMGNGIFTSSTIIPDQGNTPIDWVDFNGDSLNDFLISGNREVIMYTQNTNGTYSKFWANNDNGRHYLNVIDVDNNNQLDILATDYYSLYVQKQTFDEKLLGTEMYNPGIPANLTQISGLIPMDKDSDGDLDLLASYQSNLYWFNNVNGTYTAQSISTTLGQAANFELTDFDSDGNPDLVVHENAMKRLEWNGSTFSISTITNSLGAKTIADVDNDGDMDVAFLYYDINTGTYTLKCANYNNNSFTDQSILPLSGIIGTNFNNGEEVLTTADIDSDGDADFILMNYGQGKVVWLRNDGGLAFVPITLTDTIQHPDRVETGDIDNDGDMDITISTANFGEVLMFTNNGSQVFTESIITDKGNLIEEMKMIDFDQDGDLDIITNSPVDNKLLLLKNTTNNCPRSYTISDTTICYGDSILIGGNYYTAPHVLSDTLSSSMGCDSINIIDLLSYQMVAPSVNSTTICPGDSVLFAGSYFTQPGQYFDTLQNVNGCDSVDQLTISHYTITPSTVLQDTNRLYTTSTFSSYQWYFNGTLLSNETLDELDAGQYGDGDYFVIGFTSDGCEVVSDTIDFIKTLVGIQTVEKSYEISVYPNPLQTETTIGLNFNSQEVRSLNLYSSNGKVIASKDYSVSMGNESIQLNLSNLSSGIVILEIRLDDELIRKKLIIQ